MAHTRHGLYKIAGFYKAKQSAPTQSITMMESVELVLRIIMDADLTTLNASDVSCIQRLVLSYLTPSLIASNSFAIGDLGPLSQRYKAAQPFKFRIDTLCSNIDESVPRGLKRKKSPR